MNESRSNVRAARLHRTLEDTRRLLLDHVNRTIDELQHALAHVTASRPPLNSRLAEIALAELVSGDTAVRVHADTVMAVTAEYFEFTVDELRSPRKTAEIVRARQIAMYLCRELAGLSLLRIGGEFDRDHTTVMHAVRKIRGEVETAQRASELVADLTTLVKRRAAIDALGVTRQLADTAGQRPRKAAA